MCLLCEQGCADEAYMIPSTLSLDINTKLTHLQTLARQDKERQGELGDFLNVPHAQCPRPDSNLHAYACEAKWRTILGCKEPFLNGLLDRFYDAITLSCTLHFPLTEGWRPPGRRRNSTLLPHGDAGVY